MAASGARCIGRAASNVVRSGLKRAAIPEAIRPRLRSIATSTRLAIEHRYNPRAQAVPATSFSKSADASGSASQSSIEAHSTQSNASSVLQTLHDDAHDITVTLHPSTVALTAPDFGLETPFHFDHVWLRDICREESSVESATQQKLFHTSDIHIPTAHDTHGLFDGTRKARLIPGIDRELPALELAYDARYPVVNAFSAAFSSAPQASESAHISRIPVSVLLEHAIPELYEMAHGDIGSVAQPWISKELSEFALSHKPPSSEKVSRGERLDEEAATSRPSRVNWGALLRKEQGSSNDGSIMTADEQARFALVDGLMRDGLAFVTGVPTDKTGNDISAQSPDSATLARLAEMLGEIRHTFYGSLWNVRSLGASSRNIAYTNLDLGLHMDLCYFQNPPRFQFLHMLRNRVKGGQSIFVDSFAVAEEIWQQHRGVWRLLSETPVCFQYRNDDRHYRYTHPTFEVASASSGHAGEPMPQSGMPRLTAVNYSPPFQGPFPLQLFRENAIHGANVTTTVTASPQKRMQFYKALQKFADLTLEPRFRYERMLQEGECVVFDNRRVLHSRRGFEWDPAQESSGAESANQDGIKRWLKGCYVDGDAIWSTYRTLRAKSRGGKLGLL